MKLVSVEPNESYWEIKRVSIVGDRVRVYIHIRSLSSNGYRVVLQTGNGFVRRIIELGDCPIDHVIVIPMTKMEFKTLDVAVKLNKG
jgi:hypothetical protein